MSKLLALVISSLTAMCSMGYELAFASFISRSIGNEVLGQTLTVGVFLLFMGLGSWRAETSPRRAITSLLNIELSLSLIGMLAPAAMQLTLGLLMLMGLIPSVEEGGAGNLYLILFTLNIPVALTGFLTGAELPLIFKALKEKVGDFDHNILLFLNYMGGLGAGLLFSALLIDGIGHGRTFHLFSMLNLAVCLALAILVRKKLYAPILVSLMAFAPFSNQIYKTVENLAIRTDYYGFRLSSFASSPINSLINAVSNHGDVKRLSSPYQTIDLVTRPGVNYAGIKTRSSLSLYLNRHFQINSAGHGLYHQSFSHGFLNLTGKKPKEALILGGGDGLLANELLKRKSLEKITLVELDPKMLELSKSHPVLGRINEGVLFSDKVNTVSKDAFTYLSEQAPSSLETIFIDFPFPNSSELKKLYSLEFYQLLHRALSERGNVILDAPLESDMETGAYTEASKTLIKTLQAAGFKTIFAFGPHRPFIVLGKTESAPKFTYDKIATSRFVDRSTYANLVEIDIEKLLRMDPLPKYINSIFKPGVFKK